MLLKLSIVAFKISFISESELSLELSLSHVKMSVAFHKTHMSPSPHIELRILSRNIQLNDSLVRKQGQRRSVKKGEDAVEDEVPRFGASTSRRLHGRRTSPLIPLIRDKRPPQSRGTIGLSFRLAILLPAFGQAESYSQARIVRAFEPRSFFQLVEYARKRPAEIENEETGGTGNL